MRGLGDQAKPFPRVDATGGQQNVVGLEDHAAVAELAGGGDAFTHQDPAKAEAPRNWIDDQQAELGHLRRFADQEDAAEILLAPALPAPRRDPAAFDGGVEGFQELPRDLGDQGFKLLIETVFAGVERAMARDHPADITGLRRAQDIAFWQAELGRVGVGHERSPRLCSAMVPAACRTPPRFPVRATTACWHAGGGACGNGAE